MASRREGAPRVGTKVYTLDMKLLGTVERVWPTARTVPDDVTENTSLTPSTPPGPLTEPGLMLVKSGDRELYIPFGAVARRRADRVVLGVPARDVDYQAWDQRPWRLAG